MSAEGWRRRSRGLGSPAETLMLDRRGDLEEIFGNIISKMVG